MEHKSQILTEDQFKGNYHGSGSMVLTGTFDGSLTIDNIFITKSGKFLGKLIKCNDKYFYLKDHNHKDLIKFKFTELDMCRLKPNYNKLIKEYSYGE